jgi:hypothetical protein
MSATIAIPMTGQCANGHNVAVTLTISAPSSDAHGVHTASAACGACGAPVALSGSF